MEADRYQEDEDGMEQDEESDDNEVDQDAVFEASNDMSLEEEDYFRDAKDFAGDIFLSIKENRVKENAVLLWYFN